MQLRASPRTKPCERRMPRCGQRSAEAEVRPVSLRQRAIDPAGVRAGITVPAGKSAERATGVQQPVVSDNMTQLSEQHQSLAECDTAVDGLLLSVATFA